MSKTKRTARISTVAMIVWVMIDILLIPILIGFVMLARHLVKFATTKLELTNSTVVGQTGFLHRQKLSCPVGKITGVKVEQKMFGQIFDYGTIIINTANNTFAFDYMDNPNGFHNAINRQIEMQENNRMEKQAQKIARAVKD